MDRDCRRSAVNRGGAFGKGPMKSNSRPPSLHSCIKDAKSAQVYNPQGSITLLMLCLISAAQEYLTLSRHMSVYQTSGLEQFPVAMIYPSKELVLPMEGCAAVELLSPTTPPHNCVSI